MVRTFVLSTLLIALTVISLGCGQPQIGDTGVKIHGKVVKAGAPMEVKRRDIGLGSIDVHLVPNDASLESHFTQAEEDGSFEFMGAGQGIAPGTYRLAVYQQVEGPGTDALKGKFSEESSPIMIEISSDKVGEDYDLGTIELDDH